MRVTSKDDRLIDMNLSGRRMEKRITHIVYCLRKMSDPNKIMVNGSQVTVPAGQRYPID